MPIIYKTTNIINGKIYVGQDKHNRPKYLGSGTRLREAIKKYGIENFTKEILEHCELEQLNEREIHWINVLESMNPIIGYNLTPGGDGVKMNDEIRDKISKAKLGHKGYWTGKKRPGLGSKFTRKGIKSSEETKRKQRESLKGHIVSEATREKLRKPKKNVKIQA